MLQRRKRGEREKERKTLKKNIKTRKKKVRDENIWNEKERKITYAENTL